jgi:hypothetical protein
VSEFLNCVTFPANNQVGYVTGRNGSILKGPARDTSHISER